MMSKREQYTRELLLSTTTGAGLSTVLCLILPGIESKADIFGLWFPLWFLLTIGIWSMFDISERVNRGWLTKLK